MCLENIDLYKQDPKLIRKGWKKGFLKWGYITSPGVMERVVVTSCFDFEIPCSMWVTDENEQILQADNGEYYESGFHIFAENPRFSLKDKYVCFVREILAIGSQWANMKAVVARQIYIPDPKKVFHRDLLIRLFGERFLPK